MLVVTSKVKKLNKLSGFNTSGETVDALSKIVEKLCAKGIQRAQADGRKTVMARDITPDLELLNA